MKIWWLKCRMTKENAIIFAKSKEEAFNKLNSYVAIKVVDIDYWDIEEFTQENYHGLLYFD